MTITTIQTDIIWENISENLKQYQSKIENLKSDIIILPEMFSTGFTMNPEKIAESMKGSTVNWMKENSKKVNSAICGSTIIKEKNKYYNRFIWVEPSGKVKYYDKKHLFSFAGEDEKYTPGNSKLIIDYKGWRICPLICYDLRFPVWSRNVENYDILIYVANWPSKRKHAWKNLLISRSIENQCYTIGVNRIGSDSNNNLYSGDTSLISALGEILYINSHVEDVYTTTLDKNDLIKIRNKFPVLNDKDNFKII
jgi:predicted amidohydrolase